MARNKSSNDIPLVAHIGVYSLVLTLVGVPLAGLMGLLWALSNGVFHFLTDWVTSRWTSHLWKKGDVHNFFVVIGLDQTIHFLTLFYTAEVLLAT